MVCTSTAAPSWLSGARGAEMSNTCAAKQCASVTKVRVWQREVFERFPGWGSTAVPMPSGLSRQEVECSFQSAVKLCNTEPAVDTGAFISLRCSFRPRNGQRAHRPAIGRGWKVKCFHPFFFFFQWNKTKSANESTSNLASSDGLALLGLIEPWHQRAGFNAPMLALTQFRFAGCHGASLNVARLFFFLAVVEL